MSRLSTRGSELLLLVLGGAAASLSCGDRTAGVGGAPSTAGGVSSPLGADPRNAEYVLSGRPVRLEEGVSEEEVAPGSAARVVTRYLGHDSQRDLDGDGREDVVFLLTQETGGSGTFYYLVAALQRQNGYQGTHGVLLGDRIAPKSTEIRPDGIVVVSYADRQPGESFATRPSVAERVWLELNPETLEFAEIQREFDAGTVTFP